MRITRRPTQTEGDVFGSEARLIMAVFLLLSPRRDHPANITQFIAGAVVFYPSPRTPRPTPLTPPLTAVRGRNDNKRQAAVLEHPEGHGMHSFTSVKNLAAKNLALGLVTGALLLGGLCGDPPARAEGRRTIADSPWPGLPWAGPAVLSAVFRSDLLRVALLRAGNSPLSCRRRRR